MWMFLVLFNNQCPVTSLSYSISGPSMWQRTVHPCRSGRVCTHILGVSSSSSSLCSSPSPPCSSPLAAAQTQRSSPQGCATANACSSSCPLSLQKYTNTPRSGRRLTLGAGRGPSVSKKAGNNVFDAPRDTPADKKRNGFSKPQPQKALTFQIFINKDMNSTFSLECAVLYVLPRQWPWAVWHRGRDPAGSTDLYGQAALTWLSAAPRA